jgi:hypothetical protein
MTKQLYEEALADVKKVTEVAEDKAKRAVLEAVIPRIRNLIERELINEDIAMMDDDGPIAGPADSVVAGAMTPPDEEGKVTLDLDAMADCGGAPAPVDQPMFGRPQPDGEYELTAESAAALDLLIKNRDFSPATIAAQVDRLTERTTRFKKAGRLIRETTAYGAKITQMISRVEDMYDYVQETVSDSKSKRRLEASLESNYRDLSALQEQTKMSKKKLIDLLKEEEETQMGGDLALDGDDDMGDMDDEGGSGELTLKLTGLGDDVDLDGVGVDLITGDGEAAGDDMGDMDMDMGAEGGGDEDMDLGGGEDELGGDEEEEGYQMEVSRLSDDTIVEIDENMLRREIRRMRGVNEEVSHDKAGDANGYGVDADVLDDFGGAEEECEAFLDGEVTTGGAEPLGEGDVDEMDEMDEMPMDEMDDLDELQNRRSADEAGEAATTHSPSESVQRRLAFESRLQKRSRRRVSALQKEARSTKNKGRRSALRKEYKKVAQRFNESVARTKKFKRQLVEARRLEESRSNSGSKQQASKAVQTLRKKLAAENLHNVKLTLANKVLQSESLSKRQKAQVIERLDEAQTPREAKLVYNTVAGTRKALKEGTTRKVMGSSSRATRSGSSQTLNEGFETDRWSRLAGITK